MYNKTQSKYMHAVVTIELLVNQLLHFSNGSMEPNYDIYNYMRNAIDMPICNVLYPQIINYESLCSEMNNDRIASYIYLSVIMTNNY